MNDTYTSDQIQSWLSQMELTFKSLREAIVILYKIEGDTKGSQFPVIINWGGGWIQIASLLAHSERIPPEKEKELYQDLLQHNWLLKDVMYSLDPNGSIFSTNHVDVNCNFENFRSELGAVVFGVSYFFNKIGPKFGLTKPPIGIKLDDSNESQESS